MGYLRVVRSAAGAPKPESACLEAYERELDYLFETLQRLGARPREIEDLAHEVFLVLHKNWAGLDTSRPLRPYIFGVAFRVVSAHRRRHRREIAYPSVDAPEARSGPEGLLESKESVALLLAALERIPLRRRAVLVMHDLDGVPMAEVAAKLSLTRFGGYARLRKARRELTAAARRLRGEALRR